MKKIVLFGLLAGIVASATAGTPPPEQPTRGWNSSLTKEPTGGIYLGSYGITFEKTTLDDVVRATALGSIAHKGDAGESVYWLCYTLSDQDRLWIISDGEMGGSEHAITGFTAQRLRGVELSSDCPVLPANFLHISLDADIWLGSSNRDLFRAFGPPSLTDGPIQSYDFETKIPGIGKCGGGYDRLNWLLTELDHGQIAVIYAGQVTSC